LTATDDDDKNAVEPEETVNGVQGLYDEREESGYRVPSPLPASARMMPVSIQ
jgi:hypothetical protein